MSKSKSHSGTTEFTFKVDRFFNEETGEILLESEIPAGSEDQFKPMVIELEISGGAYFSPGRYTDLPENCYPDESDIDINSITYLGKDWSGLITVGEESDILDLIAESVAENSEYDYDDYDDSDCDDSYDFEDYEG